MSSEENMSIRHDDTPGFCKAILEYGKIHESTEGLEQEVEKARSDRTRALEALLKFKRATARACLIDGVVWMMSTTGGVKSYPVESPEGKAYDKKSKEESAVGCPVTF